MMGRLKEMKCRNIGSDLSGKAYLQRITKWQDKVAISSKKTMTYVIGCRKELAFVLADSLLRILKNYDKTKTFFTYCNPKLNNEEEF